MNLPFILFVGSRYFKEKRKTRKTASSLLSITGIAVGVMTLTSVIGVMNGFQLSFIEPILNIGSYHIRVSGDNPIDDGKLAALRSLPDVTAVIPFVEIQALVEGKSVCIIRGIPAEIESLDPSISNSFDLDSFEKPDAATLSDQDSIVIGNQLAAQLGIRKGDEISLTTFRGGWSSRKKVTGLFQTWYYDIDRTWGFISLETAKEFFAEGRLPLIYGIKIRDRFSIDSVMQQITAITGSNGIMIQSWREFNRSFFGALLMEKILMMVLVGLIFIVVGFNIFHSLKRSVFERKEDIALLKALGASPSSIKNIFILEGFLIGLLGCLSGIVLGLLVANNINEIFKFTEYLVNNIILENAENLLRQVRINAQFTRVSIFSSDIFYIKNVPIKVLFPETFLISLFAMLCSFLAALFASGRVAAIKPAEILRYE